MVADFRYLVVGAGMIGAAAARHLSLVADKVALVGPPEPRVLATHDGVFASHYDEARITRTIDGSPVWARLANRSIARYDAIAADSGIPFFTNAGCLIAGPGRSVPDGTVANVLKAAARLGVDTEVLAGADRDARFPFLRLPPASEAVFEQKGAGHINPRRLVAAQIRLATRNGAVLVPEQVAQLEETGPSVAVVTTAGRTLTADKVLVAAGGFTNSGSLLPARLDLKVFARTVAFFELDVETAGRLAAMPALIVVPEGAADSVYLLPPVRYPDGKTYLKIGGDPEDIALESDAEIRAWFRSGGSPATGAHLTRIARALVPGLPKAPAALSACVTSYTPTDLPAIGRVGSARIAVATGGCGRAAKSSDEIGRLGAEFLLHDRIVDPAYDADFAPRLH